jgi:hypothetical protein
MKTSKLSLALIIALTALIPILAPSAMAGNGCPPGSIWRAAREARQHTSQTPTEAKSEPVQLTHDEKVTRITEAIALQKFDDAINYIDSLVGEGYWPPEDSVNAKLAKLKSPYRLLITKSTAKKPNPEDHCRKGPHGGGCLRLFTLEIREKGSKTAEREWVSRQFLVDDSGTVFDRRPYCDRNTF